MALKGTLTRPLGRTDRNHYLEQLELKLEQNHSFIDDDGVLREIWMNKSPPKFSLTNVFDGYASYLEVVANFSLSYNDGPFAERLRTFLHANESGEFQFQLSCTYQCELWISPTDEIEGKVQIISHDASANGGVSLRYVRLHDFLADELTGWLTYTICGEGGGLKFRFLLTGELPSCPGSYTEILCNRPTDCLSDGLTGW